MSSSNNSVADTIETLFEKSIESFPSSEEPPIEEWSSILLGGTPEENPKKMLYDRGLYNPGSGEICGKMFEMSNSSLLNHVYYNYPRVPDPGVMAALFKYEPKKIYACDGQELYTDLCKEMNVIPVRSFLRGLVNTEIDLKYYGVNPIGIRAMCLALENNTLVRRLDLSSNFLNLGACYHLGQLLYDTLALQELVLSGCRIGPAGLRFLIERLPRKRIVHLLDLSRNQLGDEGFKHLANQIGNGVVFERLNLSHNELTRASVKLFAEVIERNNTITHLDLSWNRFFVEKGLDAFLFELAESKVLEELNLSWNMITTSEPWKKVVGMNSLQVLDLSHNRLETPAVRMICITLHNAKKLHTLNLSHNRLKPSDALLLLNKMKSKRIKVENLYMDDTVVCKTFVETLQCVLSLQYRANTTITHGPVHQNYTIPTANLTDIVMRRVQYLGRPKKKSNFDIALFFLQARKETRFIDSRDISYQLKKVGVTFDDDLLAGMCDCFPGPKNDRGNKTMDLDGVVEYVRRLWPGSKLPPTPPEPQIEPILQSKTKKKNKK